MILIGLLAEAAGDELFAGHALDGGQHAIVADALPPQPHDEFDLLVLDFVHGRVFAHGAGQEDLRRLRTGPASEPSASLSALEVR